MRTQELFKFVRERHAIYERRKAGLPKPWTKDAILQRFRFCNIYRELDTVTRWITVNWRTPQSANPDFWFAMAVARLVNWPDSLAEMGYPVKWDAKKFQQVLDSRKKRGEKAFTSAYMIHCGYAGSSKASYLAKEVLTPMWEARQLIRPRKGDTLAEFHDRLLLYRDMGTFMAGQIIADTKYAASPLKDASDWWTWAASGPGSRRGLNRLLGRDLNASWKEVNWLAEIQKLQQQLGSLVVEAGMPALHAQDVQSCLCEFDKYERTRLGDATSSRPRQLYPGV